MLAYQHVHVVDKFLEAFAIPRPEAELLFDDVKRWLWLARKRRLERSRQAALHVPPCLSLLDEMWHTFVLFTYEYASFCDEYLGAFVHHAPTTKAQKDALSAEYERDPAAAAHKRKEHDRVLVTLVVEELGTEVARRWFSDYARRYPPATIARLHKYGNPGLELDQAPAAVGK